jgi:hypothetical protein
MKSALRSSHVRRVTRRVVRVKATKSRTGYSYVRKAGISRVSAVPAKDVGASGKSTKVIGKLKGGMLTKYGYHPVEAKTNRYKALSKGIIKGEKPLSVMRRLIAISVLTKRTLPRASRIYKSDAMWIRRKYAKSFKTSM